MCFVRRALFFRPAASRPRPSACVRPVSNQSLPRAFCVCERRRRPLAVTPYGGVRPRSSSPFSEQKRPFLFFFPFLRLFLFFSCLAVTLRGSEELLQALEWATFHFSSGECLCGAARGADRSLLNPAALLLELVDSSGLVMLLVIYVLFVLIPMSRRVAKSETREPVRLAVHHVSLDAARPSV